MRKKFKRKKRLKIDIFIYTFLFILIVLILKNFIFKIESSISNQKFVKNILYNIDNKTINNIVNYIDNNIFNNPISFLESELKLVNTINKTESFAYVSVDKPKIYIYNSHQGEEYSKKYLEEYNIVPTVLTASKMLSEKLNKLGINTIVEESDILEYMNNNNLDHSGSYIASRHFLEKAMNKFKDIDLYIDLHRDSINYSTSLVNINGKDCAKILFVIGLEYNTYNENLKVVEKINNIINKKYPNLSRGILKKEGYGVNGVYNQDLSSNVILIEIGGYENNIDEINNTLDFLASALKEYFNEKK